eukprot:5104331-Amphidinium_carterae.1
MEITIEWPVGCQRHEQCGTCNVTACLILLTTRCPLILDMGPLRKDFTLGCCLVYSNWACVEHPVAPACLEMPYPRCPNHADQLTPWSRKVRGSGKLKNGAVLSVSSPIDPFSWEETVSWKTCPLILFMEALCNR